MNNLHPLWRLVILIGIVWVFVISLAVLFLLLAAEVVP